MLLLVCLSVLSAVVVSWNSWQTEWYLYLCKLSSGNDDTTQLVNIFTLVSSLNHKWMCHGMLVFYNESGRGWKRAPHVCSDCSVQHAMHRSTTCGFAFFASPLTLTSVRPAWNSPVLSPMRCARSRHSKRSRFPVVHVKPLEQDMVIRYRMKPAAGFFPAFPLL